MMADPNPSQPVFALIMTGEDYMFVKLDRVSSQPSALSLQLLTLPTLPTLRGYEFHRGFDGQWVGSFAVLARSLIAKPGGGSKPPPIWLKSSSED